MDTPTVNQDIFRFYDLPAELREQILKNLLLSKAVFIDPGDTKQPYVDSKILRINRQIYEQGLALLHQKNTFRFAGVFTIRDWVISQTTLPSRKEIRNIILHASIRVIMTQDPSEDGQRRLNWLNEANFPHLERLTLAFQNPIPLNQTKRQEFVQRISSVNIKKGLKELKIVGLEPRLKRMVLEGLKDWTA
ncbi:MAG: hypothetical protein M1812_005380 [Candelaria pacifica]|nr:MAG: hypothetical protein M1812_005380 [Candelaria pacifica]